MKRFRSRAVFGALAVIMSFGLTACERFEAAMVERAMLQVATPDRSDWLDDGALHLVLCGTGSPMPDPTRAGPCAAVIAGGHFFIIDAGPGSWENLQVWRLPRARLSAVLLTHFHSDHIGELGEVATQSWIGGRSKTLTVYGPEGVTQVVDGFSEAYALDVKYRVAHHGEKAMPTAGSGMRAEEVLIGDGEESALVFEDAGVRVTAFRVDHDPVAPAYGYRFEYAGRSLFITGDTAKNAGAVAGARGTDLMLSEVLVARVIARGAEFLAEGGHERLARLANDILDYHVSPDEAVEMASEAGVGALVFTHIVPPPPNAIAERMFMRGVGDSWDGEVLMGRDGMHFTLPGNSDAIERENLAD